MVEHIRKTSESIILALVVLSPWAFGCIHPFFRYCLTAGISLLLALWAVELLIEPKRGLIGRFQIPLLALVAIVGLQLIPNASIANALAPTGAVWRAQLMPEQMEVLADGDKATSPAMAARDRVSLYPAETFRRGYWLLLMVLLFSRVQDLATVDSLRRLCYTCLINGSILAYFSIFQHFTEDEHGKIFFTFQSMGTAFGPFVNRNHFAFYINICFGLSLGLVGSRFLERNRGFGLDSIVESLKDNLSLWMLSVLVFMLGSVILCSSRGGMISLLGSMLITAAFAASTGTFRRGWWWFVLAAGIFGVAAWVQVWLGFDFENSRYANASDNRTALWLPLLKLVREFPILGTGLGTLPFVEPWTRTSATQNAFLEYAHNEYLQLAIETGLLGLGCGCIFLLLLSAKIAKRIRESRQHSWLYVGLLFSLASVALHSFTEFGLAIPAIAFLTAIVFGHIAGLGEVISKSAKASLFESGLSRVAAIGILGFAFMAFQQAKRFDLGERYLLAAQRAQNDGRFDEELENYRKAITHTPNDVEFLMEVARLRLEQFEAETLADPIALKEAQQVLVTVRELSPMSGLAHYMIGRHRSTFQEANEPLDYYLRAGLSRPMDPTLAYLTGLLYLENGNTELGLANFKRSLQLSSEATYLPRDKDHLDEVLDKLGKDISWEELKDLLPTGDPISLIKAADWFTQKQKQYGETDRDSNIVNSLRRLAVDSGELASPNTLQLWQKKATLYLQLGDKGEAIKTLERATRYAPKNPGLRMQLARHLKSEKRYKEAIAQMKQLLRWDDDHVAGKKLLKELVYIVARGPSS